MKLIKMILLPLLFTSMHALAATPSLICETEDAGSDGRFNFEMNSESITFNFHEATFSVPRSAITSNGNSHAALNKSTIFYAEGTESQTKVNFLIVHDPKEKHAEVSIIGDLVSVKGQELNCNK